MMFSGLILHATIYGEQLISAANLVGASLNILLYWYCVGRISLIKN